MSSASYCEIVKIFSILNTDYTTTPLDKVVLQLLPVIKFKRFLETSSNLNININIAMPFSFNSYIITYVYVN